MKEKIKSEHYAKKIEFNVQNLSVKSQKRKNLPITAKTQCKIFNEKNTTRKKNQQKK